MSVQPVQDDSEVLCSMPKWDVPELESSDDEDSTGLKALTEIDLLIIAPEKKVVEMFLGYEMKKKYMVKNKLGNDIYFVEEEGNLLDRQLFGRYRTIDLRIFDKNSKDIIYLHRLCRCALCCFPCCLQKMVVESPPGNAIGYIIQTWTVCQPNFTVKDSSKKTVFTIKSVTSQWKFCGRVEYMVESVEDKTEIGRVGKDWVDEIMESSSGMDLTNFGISFPADLDVNLKAVLLGAVVFIDILLGP